MLIIYIMLSLVLLSALGIISVQLGGRSGTSSPPWGLFTDGLGLVWGIFSGEGDLALPPALHTSQPRFFGPSDLLFISSSYGTDGMWPC